MMTDKGHKENKNMKPPKWKNRDKKTSKEK